MERSDDELLAAGGSAGFAVFYRRHADDVLRYFARRVHEPEAAADLTAETFAAAVLARERFRPDRGSGAAWLFGIAGHKLADFQRRGYLEDRARRELGMQRREPAQEDVAVIQAMSREVVSTLLAELPRDQRQAVAGHVIEDESYEALADRAGVSESAMRHRVSRGLRALRRGMEGKR